MTTETATKTINLRPDTEDRRDSYGVLLVSETLHDVVGSGVHNPAFPHRIQVWENRPAKYRDAPAGLIVDPHGKPTEERYSYLTSAESVVISARPYPRDPQGPTLCIGDVVELAVHGYVIGRFEVTAKSLSNPILVPVA